LSTSFSFNLSTSVVPRARKVFPAPLVNACKASLNVEEHQIGDFFTVSETSSEWVAVRIDLGAREVALCTMLLSSLALSADTEVVRMAYSCTTLPPRGEKAVISLGFNVAFGNQDHAKKDVERVESLRSEKLQGWRAARVGTSTPATTSTSVGTSVGTAEEGEGSVKL